VIALLGIVNTPALTVTERTRELGVLRAVGMRHGQVAATLAVEGGMIAVLGAVLGIALGTALGGALAAALTGAASVAVPGGNLVVYVVVSVLAATLAALVWVNLDSSSYETVWRTRLSIRVGDSGVTQDLRDWINSGLMTFFFFVVGLEARREFDLGELRERRRFALPLLAGIGGIVVPIAIYLAANAGRPSAHGWGAAMSTDTAFALGMLALVGPRFPERLRAFMLTVVVVDDIVALGVIAIAYSGHVATMALIVAFAIFGAILLVRAGRIRYGLVYALLGVAAWVALFKSGVDPIVIGLAMGLLTFAYPAARSDLERASDLFRLFREQPTPELARSAQVGVAAAISPNERLQQLYHPWTSYVIVPLFALANAGIAISGGLLSRAFTEARRPQRGALCIRREPARLSRHRVASDSAAHPRASRDRGRHRRPRGAGRRRA
jgi:Na+/H+ antiporter NhaA